MWAEEKYRSVFRRPTEDALIALAKAAGNSRLRDHIVADGKVRDGLLVPSRLREAPAIGAAIDGYRASMA